MIVSETVLAENESIVSDNAVSTQINLTNLTPPRLRAEAIRRGDLVDRRLTSSARLGVISGSAGSGKSTLLAQCHTADECPAWLTLTPADNDPVHLWVSIVASIQEKLPGFGRAYIDRLVAGQTAIDGIVTSVANELAERQSGIHLFLDDLHLVEDTDCLRSLHALIGRLPRDVRVTAASRTTGPLPLARWRVEGELIELTQHDLALSDEEAAAVLLKFGIEVESELVTLLNERVEGWPAGITLASMALLDIADSGEFIRAFAGTDRSVAQFLVTEVLTQLAPRERQFLHKTAVLRQMSGDLCDAMTGRQDSARILAELEESNAFVIALDRTGGWYRYHHMFADLLVAEAQEDPVEEARLHVLAFEWFRDHGDIGEATHHGLLAGRHTVAADLLCANWFQLMNQGRLATVHNLIGQFPDSEIAGHQPLALMAAFASGMSGRLAESRRYLEMAEHVPYDGPPPDGTASMESCLALTRGCLALDGIGPAMVDAELAYELEPQTSPWKPLAALVTGLARMMSGDVDGSVAFLKEASRSPDRSMRSYALAELALVELMRDEPGRAAMLANEACEIVEEIHNNDLIHAAAAHAVLALSSLALGDKKQARKSLRKARRPMTSLGQAMPMDTMNAAVLLAQAAVELGEPKEAARYVDQAKRIEITVADTGAMGVRLEQIAASLPSVSVSAGTDPVIFTDRELEVLALLPAQLTTREMAEELFLGRNTIKTYLRRIYQKLGATSRDEAIDRARELGAITQVRP